jgi:hypothetical protein
LHAPTEDDENDDTKSSLHEQWQCVFDDVNTLLGDFKTKEGSAVIFRPMGNENSKLCHLKNLSILLFVFPQGYIVLLILCEVIGSYA